MPPARVTSGPLPSPSFLPFLSFPPSLPHSLTRRPPARPRRPRPSPPLRAGPPPPRRPSAGAAPRPPRRKSRRFRRPLPPRGTPGPVVPPPGPPPCPRPCPRPGGSAGPGGRPEVRGGGMIGASRGWWGRVRPRPGLNTGRGGPESRGSESPGPAGEPGAWCSCHVSLGAWDVAGTWRPSLLWHWARAWGCILSFCSLLCDWDTRPRSVTCVRNCCQPISRVFPSASSPRGWLRLDVRCCCWVGTMGKTNSALIGVPWVVAGTQEQCCGGR